MKKVLLTLLLLASPASAQIITTPLPVTLTNGTLADANQVMSDFNAIVTGVNTNGAKNGINSDIMALNGLTTPLTPAQGGSSVYTGGGSGTANAQLVVTPTPINYSLRAGNTVNFIPSISNTAATTLSVAGTAATAVMRQTAGGLQPLVGGEILISQIATVIYDGTQYELINSAVTANVLPCTQIDYAGAVLPSGYLTSDGSSQLRATFPALFACITKSAIAATTTSGNANIVLTAPVSTQVGWYVGGANVTCNSTITVVSDSQHITISATAGSSGGTTLTIGPYPQGDCSTTFNLPNFNGRVAAGADAVGSTLTSTTCTNPASIGSQCGTQTKTFVAANIPTLTSVNASQSITVTVPGTGASRVAYSSNGDLLPFSATGGGAFVAQYSAANNWAYFTSLTGSNSITTTYTNGSPTPVSSLAPIGLVTKAIKF